MIDKIYRRSNYEVVIYFTNRGNVTIHSGDGKALELAMEILYPKPTPVDLEQDEPTQIIELCAS